MNEEEEEYQDGAEIDVTDPPQLAMDAHAGSTRVGPGDKEWAEGKELTSEDHLRGAELSEAKVRQLVGAFTAREEKFMFRRAVSRLQEMRDPEPAATVMT